MYSILHSIDRHFKLLYMLAKKSTLCQGRRKTLYEVVECLNIIRQVERELKTTESLQKNKLKLFHTDVSGIDSSEIPGIV